MLQYLEKLQQEDLEILIKKREVQQQLMEDVSKANEVSTVLQLNYAGDDHSSWWISSRKLDKNKGYEYASSLEGNKVGYALLYEVSVSKNNSQRAISWNFA